MLALTLGLSRSSERHVSERNFKRPAPQCNKRSPRLFNANLILFSPDEIWALAVESGVCSCVKLNQIPYFCQGGLTLRFSVECVLGRKGKKGFESLHMFAKACLVNILFRLYDLRHLL